jgi:hypothetical protein
MAKIEFVNAAANGRKAKSVVKGVNAVDQRTVIPSEIEGSRLLP